MSRTRARFVLYTAIGALAFSQGGCGNSAAVDAEKSHDGTSVPPAILALETPFIARPIEDRSFVRASSAVPLPGVEEGQGDNSDDRGEPEPTALGQITGPAESENATEDGRSVVRDEETSTAPASLSGPVIAPRLEAVSDENSLVPQQAPPATAIMSDTMGQHQSAPRFADAYAVHPKPAAADDAPPLAGASEPTPELIAVARQADAHIARGIDLAQRGATFSARAEFVQALRLSAAGLDAQRRSTAHTRALENGLCALEEAEDFLPALAHAKSSAPLSTIVRSHRTAVLDDTPADQLSASVAIKEYLTYAQGQLSAASGDLAPAAAALYALGKLEMTAASMDIGSLESARAAVYLQAALIVNPRHALAANELGVLLARRGRLEQAKSLFLYCVGLERMPAAWRNLAIVHQDLGEHDLAERAGRQWQQLTQSHESAGSGRGGASQAADSPAVVWVDPTTFAQNARFNGEITAAENQAARAPAGKPSAAAPAAKTAWPWSPWHSQAR